MKAREKYRAAWTLRVEEKTFREIKAILHLKWPEQARMAVAKGRRIAGQAVSGKVGAWVSEQSARERGEDDFPEKVMRDAWVTLPGSKK